MVLAAAEAWKALTARFARDAVFLFSGPGAIANFEGGELLEACLAAEGTCGKGEERASGPPGQGAALELWPGDRYFTEEYAMIRGYIRHPPIQPSL